MKHFETISRCSDVRWLVSNLRIAKNEDDLEMQRAVLSKLQDINVLRELTTGEDVQFTNFRNEVNNILAVNNYTELFK